MAGRGWWKNGLAAALCLWMGLAASEGAAQGDERFEALLAEVETGLANAPEVEEDARRSGAIDPSEAARRVAISLAKAGHFDHAARIAAAIADPWDQARAVRDVVLAHLAREDLDAATRLDDVSELIARIARDPAIIAELVVEISDFFAKQGESDGAIETLSRAEGLAAAIADESQRGQVLALAAGKYAELGETDLAMALVNRIKDEFWRTAGHEIVAILLAEMGDFTGSEQVASLIDDEGIDERDKAYGHLAESLALAGQPMEARRVVGRITGTERQAAALAMVGAAFASQDESGARDMFAEAEALAAGLAEPKARALAQTGLAWGYARAGWVEEATAAADRLVRTDAGPWVISSGLEQVAVALWSKGERVAALDEIGAAERCAALIKDAEDRSEQQLAIVRVLI